MGTLYQRSGGIFSANFVIKGIRHRTSLHTRDPQEARKKAYDLIKTARLRARGLNPMAERAAIKRLRYIPADQNADWDTIVNDGAMAKGWTWYMYNRALDRAKRRHVGISITLEDIVNIAKRSAGFCEVTGLAFSWDKMNGSIIGPYAPSLDRIDPMRGYQKTNIRLVCNCVNAAMGSWGEEVLFAIAGAMYEFRQEPMIEHLA